MSYTPDPTLCPEQRSAYRSFYAKTALVPRPTLSIELCKEARVQWKADPGGLTDDHLSALATFDTDNALKAYDARIAARTPPPPPPVAPAVATPQRAQQRKRERVKVSPELAAAMVELATKSAGIVAFATADALVTAANDAFSRYFSGKRQDISDRDIAVLNAFDGELAQKAVRRKAGCDWWRDAEGDAGTPLWFSVLAKHADVSAFIAVAHKHRLTELMDRITVLEARPELKYCGAFRTGETYGEGSLATHQGGLWLAESPTTFAPGLAGSGWRLVVKSGRG